MGTTGEPSAWILTKQSHLQFDCCKARPLRWQTFPTRETNFRVILCSQLLTVFVLSVLLKQECLKDTSFHRDRDGMFTNNPIFALLRRLIAHRVLNLALQHIGLLQSQRSVRC